MKGGQHVGMACGVVGDPILGSERAGVEEDGSRRMVEPPKRVKTVHDQVKYMEEKLLYYFPSDDDREDILEDFKRVVGSIHKIGLNSKNIGHYDYFIIRLAARRKIPIRELTEEEVGRITDKEVEGLIWKKVQRNHKHQSKHKREVMEAMNKEKDKQYKKYIRDREAYKWVTVPKIKRKPEDIKTPEVLQRMDDLLYGKIFPPLGWDTSLEGNKEWGEILWYKEPEPESPFRSKMRAPFSLRPAGKEDAKRYREEDKTLYRENPRGQLVPEGDVSQSVVTLTIRPLL